MDGNKPTMRKAVVDAYGSQLILAEDVSRSPSDTGELEWAWETMSEAGMAPQRILVDAGYASSDTFEKLEDKVDLYVAVSSADHGERRYDFRPPREKPPKKIRSEEGRRIYAKRKSTVEPTFGIIKAPMGFRQFMLRGMEKGYAPIHALTQERGGPCGSFSIGVAQAVQGESIEKLMHRADKALYESKQTRNNVTVSHAGGTPFESYVKYAARLRKAGENVTA